MKNRTELARYMNSLNLKKGAEIGVARGDNAEMLCREIPGLELWCIDVWCEYKGNNRGGSQRKHDNNYNQTVERLKPYNTHIMISTSMDAVETFKDGELDFCYIDGNHDYKYVLEDITEWSKKVRKGGIISGHDAYIFKNSGVLEALEEYKKTHPDIDIQLTEQNHDPDYDERHPSWWFIK